MSDEKLQIIVGSLTIVISLIGLAVSSYRLFFYKPRHKNNSFDSANMPKSSKTRRQFFANNLAVFCFSFFAVLLLVGISFILGWIKLK